jgi:hypothetical protein
VWFGGESVHVGLRERGRVGEKRGEGAAAGRSLRWWA